MEYYHLKENCDMLQRDEPWRSGKWNKPVTEDKCTFPVTWGA